MKKFKELKLMVEEKKDKYDEGEYDQEGDMAKSDLRSIMANAKELHDMIDDADNLPEWCQNKITLAEDYISTVANYLTAEMSEEVSKADVPAYLRKQKGEKPLTMADVKAPRKDSISAKENLAKARNEEVEQIGESGGDVVYKKGDHHIEKYGENSFALYKDGKKQKFYTSIEAAKSAMNEEVEQIDELSNKTLYSYLRKTGAVRSSTEVHPRNTSNVPHDLQYQAQDSAKSRINARKGHGSVAPKGYAKEEVEQIDEKNVPTSPEKWAQAKSQAKAKFDVYPSAYANGWAAKKYKAMGGSWKSVSEATDPPFDKPYTTIKKVVTDKSGAKHGPMSRARDIARMAMKKQMEKMKPVKESLEESRKAEIVKEIMKKKKDKSEDAFQKDPELTTTLTKGI